MTTVEIDVTTLVVNINHHQRHRIELFYDVYVGRPKGGHSKGEHYGNPFSHLVKAKAQVIVPSREDAILAFRSWLAGSRYPHIEPERRRWILANLHTLRSKVLACWCAPLACHGHVLAKIANDPELLAKAQALL